MLKNRANNTTKMKLTAKYKGVKKRKMVTVFTFINDTHRIENPVSLGMCG